MKYSAWNILRSKSGGKAKNLQMCPILWKLWPKYCHFWCHLLKIALKWQYLGHNFLSVHPIDLIFFFTKCDIISWVKTSPSFNKFILWPYIVKWSTKNALWMHKIMFFQQQQKQNYPHNYILKPQSNQPEKIGSSYFVL